MEEALVTFETAKLAKEKGLDLEFCNLGWHGDFDDLEADNYPFLNTYSYYTATPCINKVWYQIQRPTQSLLQKWLRDNHNTHIAVYPIKKHWEMDVRDCTMCNEVHSSLFVDANDKFKTYEEALEVGLQLALCEIKITK